jgi:hypothetical protein
MWEVTRVSDEESAEHGTVSHYECLGRVAWDGAAKLFFVEDARWKADWNGLEYARRPRGYLTYRGALAAMLRPKPPAS